MTIGPRQAVGSGVHLVALLGRLAERRPKRATGASSPVPIVVTQAALAGISDCIAAQKLVDCK
jgi:hypothetical protein